jgi:dTDP-glucose 4,6-dehydratase
VAVDNLVTGSERNIAELRKQARFSYLFADIVEGLQLDGPVDFVYNLASPASPLDFSRIPLEILRVGSMGTENGLKLAESKQALFLQASTSEVYGDPLVHPQREDYWGNVNPVGPRAVYDEAKRYGEALVSAYERTRGAQVRIVRIFNTYGPRMRLDDGRVVPALVSQALKGEPLTIFGDGKQTRSFCFSSDLIDGIVRLSRSEVRGPVNIGNPREMTILEFAEAVMAAVGTRSKIDFRPHTQDDPKQRRPDISRARELLGWEPKVRLEEGLQQTLQYFRSVL